MMKILKPKRNRFTYLVASYLLTVVLFVVAKAGFMLCQQSDFPVDAAEFCQVVAHGLSLDLFTSLYLILFPFVVTAISLWWHKGWRWLCLSLYLYHLITSIAMAIILVADASLYSFWHFRLNASMLDFLDNPSGITQSVSVGYLLLRLAAIALLSWGFCRFYLLFLPRQIRALPFRLRAANSVLQLLLCIPIVIGIRGGTGESTTNVGQVYFSQRQYLNHAAVNPLFSFISSFKHGEKDYFIYHDFSDEECMRLTHDIYTTKSIGSDSLLNTKHPNIVVVLLEGSGAIFTELAGVSHVMPHLNRLMHEGVNFTQCYGNSWRTDRGTVCALSGYPSFPNVSVMKMPDKSQTMPSIAASLKREGYQTAYLYGGDINFTNMRSYLVGTGFERLYSTECFSKEEQRSAQWGVRDDITFRYLADLIIHRNNNEEKGKQQSEGECQPLMIGFSTLSSHEPWDVPIHRMDDPVLNAFAYLDDCIGHFVETLRKSEAWKDLLIILLPDHGISHGTWDNTKLQRNQIPMLWLGGAVKQPVTIPTLCNQSDLPATLLGQLGIPHDDFEFSRDVLSKTYTRPTAMNTFTSGFMIADTTGHIIYDLDFKQFTVSQSPHAEELLQLGKAILQRTSSDLKHR